MAISHSYWHLVLKNGNFTLLLTSTGQEWQLRIAMTSTGKEWQYHIVTNIYWWRMAISHYYWHFLVKNGNFTLQLISSGEDWLFHTVTDILWSRLAIITLLLTSSRQECQFHIATDMSVVKNGYFTLLLISTGHRLAISRSYWHLSGQEWQFLTLLLTCHGEEWQIHIASDI